MELRPMERPILLTGQRRTAVLALVVAHVLLQRVSVHIGLLAARAGVGLVHAVNPRVDVQPPLVDKALFAVRAGEGAHTRVKLEVLPEQRCGS